MKPSERNMMNAKWYCTNGLILTTMANVIQTQWLSLVIFACAVVQYAMIAIELGNFQRNVRAEELERREMKKRLTKIIKDTDNIISEWEDQLNEKKKTIEKKTKTTKKSK